MRPIRSRTGFLQVAWDLRATQRLLVGEDRMALLTHKLADQPSDTIRVVGFDFHQPLFDCKLTSFNPLNL